MLDEESNNAEAKRRHALAGPPELWLMKRNFQIAFLRNAGLSAENTLLDFGCGTLRGGIPLIRYLAAGNYFGLESRTDVMVEALNELRESGLSSKLPTLRHSPDLFKLLLGRQFDYIWAFSVLIHMDDAMLNIALDFARRHLASNGSFYANVNVGGAQDFDPWQGFPVVMRPFAFYRETCARNGLCVQDVGALRDLGHIAHVALQDDQRMLKFTLEEAPYSPANQS